ncbi:carbohydrate ABC transporter permease [Kineosporia rhizophila]|uniref:carbohydrate ABC transporter permease n=2 Tax=Kineosporia TaxID=49184 RepID=UPI000A637BB9|nr:MULTISPECIES: carbohydrate ABC transporter permease [Kineosporia]MCE0537453.1 carbohydrate ABC transporter permease [Kineosporia rhizophila]GLY17397.1 ABC transporter permease [Kineosporia sp. NBRC 101677]
MSLNQSEIRTTDEASLTERVLPQNKRRRRTGLEWFALGFTVLVAVVMAAPLLLVLLNAVKSPQDFAEGGPLSFPTEIYLDGIKTFWNAVNFPQKVWNSILISSAVAVFGVLISILNAYALGIGRIKGRMWVLVAFLLATIVPQEALLYPLYIMFKDVGLYDTVWSVVIVFVVIHGAFGTYLLASVFGAFPRELLEAAQLDGANRRQILWRVVVPVCRPTLAVLAVFFFIWTWNEFLIPLSFLVSEQNQTVQVGIATLQGERIMNVTTISASALLGIAPTLIFFLLFQRTLTRGLTAGAIK